MLAWGLVWVSEQVLGQALVLVPELGQELVRVLVWASEQVLGLAQVLVLGLEQRTPP